MFPKISLNRLRGGDILDRSVEHAEQVFLAPPFTEEVAEAVSLIQTSLPFKADEASRLLFQNHCNAVSQKEYEALLPVFRHIGKPRRVLEIGPGVGRSVVFFSKKGVLGDESEIHLYDTDGTSTKYKQKHYDRPPKWPDVSSFCGNLGLLRDVLEYNGVHNFKVFDARQLPLHQLPGPYDLIYSFYSIGFHWSVEFYLDELDPLMHDRSVLVCTLNKHFRPTARLGHFSARVLECAQIKKNAPPLRLLVLSKGGLPAVGATLQEAFPA